MRFCTDYSYFHVGIAFGDICDGLYLTLHFGFWAVEFPIRVYRRIK